MYNRALREKKAETIVRVLKDHFNDTSSLNVLDVSASTGFIDYYLADHVRRITGIDIDTKAIRHARESHNKSNLFFDVGDALNLTFADDSFDAVICTHLYEHVPDAKKLMNEIYRVLVKGGVCYFAAGNRLQFMEPHYRLPLLSCLPKPLAHLYFRVSGKGRYYYENHLTVWSLKRLAKKYKRIDYTEKIVNYPEVFAASYLLEPGGWKQSVAKLVLKYAYFIFPTYIWLLEK